MRPFEKGRGETVQQEDNLPQWPLWKILGIGVDRKEEAVVTEKKVRS